MRAAVNGHELEYDVRGSGTPVLLIMGLAMSRHAWEPQVVGLADRHTVITFDNRGIGGSTGGTSPYHITALAHDAVGLLDHLGIDAAHITGVSMGGMIAQHVALEHAPRTRSLALIATHSGSKPRALPRGRAVLPFVKALRKTGPDRARAVLELLYPPEAIERIDLAEYSESLKRDLGARQSLTAVLMQIQAIVTHNTKARLPELAATPTLIVRPGRDVLVRPSNSDKLHAAIPGSRLVSFQEAGHAVTAQCAHEVNASLLSHYARAEA